MVRSIIPSTSPRSSQGDAHARHVAPADALSMCQISTAIQHFSLQSSQGDDHARHVVPTDALRRLRVRGDAPVEHLLRDRRQLDPCVIQDPNMGHQLAGRNSS